METVVPLKEKIIIYVDTSPDVTLSKLCSSDREPMNSFERLQKLVRLFVMNKEGLCCNSTDFNQFALMVDLSGSPSLLDAGDWHDGKRVIERLGTIRLLEESGSVGSSEDKALNIGEAIKTVQQSVYVHSSDSSSDPNEGVPLYTTRLILFVTRCRSAIQLHETEDLKRVLNNPFFVVDVLYLHDNASNENLVESNLLTLNQLNELQQGRGYVLDSGPDVTNWHNVSALLLPNPRIRATLAEIVEEQRPQEVLITLS